MTTFVEVGADMVPPRTQRIAERAIRTALAELAADPAAARTVRWFAPFDALRGPAIGAALGRLAADHTALTDSTHDRLAGYVRDTAPLEVWLRVDLDIRDLPGIARHEAFHSWAIELTGPARDGADLAAHELAAQSFVAGYRGASGPRAEGARDD